MSRRRAVTQTLLFTDYQHYPKYTCFEMDRYARSTSEIPTWGFNVWGKVQFRGPGGRSNIPSTRAQHLRCCQMTASPSWVAADSTTRLPLRETYRTGVDWPALPRSVGGWPKCGGLHSPCDSQSTAAVSYHIFHSLTAASVPCFVGGPMWPWPPESSLLELQQLRVFYDTASSHDGLPTLEFQHADRFVRNGCSAVATKSSKLTCGHTAELVVFDIVVVSFDLNYSFSSLHRACVLTRWS